jgi:hypothetical protein
MGLANNCRRGPLGGIIDNTATQLESIAYVLYFANEFKLNIN